MTQAEITSLEVFLDEQIKQAEKNEMFFESHLYDAEVDKTSMTITLAHTKELLIKLDLGKRLIKEFYRLQRKIDQEPLRESVPVKTQKITLDVCGSCGSPININDDTFCARCGVRLDFEED